MSSRMKGVTLLEMLIALTLVGVVALGLMSMDSFSRNQAVSGSQMVTMQEEATNALEHMQKRVEQAIGNTVEWPITLYPADQGFSVRVDTNLNGRLDAADQWVAYRNSNNQILFYPNAGGAAFPPGGAAQVVSNRIRPSLGQANRGLRGLIIDDGHAAGLNLINVRVQTCWDNTRDCDDPTPGGQRHQDNPTFSSRTSMSMPSVSTN